MTINSKSGIIFSACENVGKEIDFGGYHGNNEEAEFFEEKDKKRADAGNGEGGKFS